MQGIPDDTIDGQTVITRDAAVPVSRNGNYEPVRFNAMKHGILSRLAVLPHEDHAEFDDLLAALMAEHRPSGMTEWHLVEDLATIIWRKRRVLLAEGARVNEGIKAAVNNSRSVMASAVPFQRGFSSESANLRDLLEMRPEDAVKSHREASLDMDATQKAAAILRKGGLTAYAKARNALIPESRDWWDKHVADESYPATAEGLAKFIQDSLEPICYQMMKESEFAPAIKAQTLGEGLQAHRLEKLNRYETHLDRKFERTLAMLLKLKDLRAI